MTPTTSTELLFYLDRNRQRSGKTIVDFANSLGMSDTMYHLWLQGKRRPGKRLLARIQDIYPDLVSEALIASAQTTGGNRRGGASAETLGDRGKSASVECGKLNSPAANLGSRAGQSEGAGTYDADPND